MGAVGDSILLQLPETLGPDWIKTAVEQLNHAGDTIVIRGGRPAFCAGLELERITAEQGFDCPAEVLALSSLLERLNSDPRPVAAVVEGCAIGAGVGLAAVGDVVIATPGASFQLPEVLWGLIPAAVIPFVARRVGWATARRMALGDRPLTAHEAAQCGLVDVVSVNPDQVLLDRLQRWRRGEASAIAAIRRLAANGWSAEEAVKTFAELWGCAAQGRIKRFVEGEAPWEDAQ
jgi:polyketide biosynthesis enoyl-CoA hydratase PksH